MIRQRIVLPVALVGVGLVGAAGGIAAWEPVASDNDSPVAVATPAATNAAAGKNLPLIDLYRRTAAGVVELTVQTQTQSDNGFSQPSGATGSGFIIDEEGHIVTNEHVIDGATTATV